MRALAIALFYAIGTAIGGLGAPALFGILLDTDRRDMLVIGYVVGAVLMIGAAVAEWWLGVPSERQSLEDIAAPLTTRRPAGLVPVEVRTRESA